jgi:chemotaxis protein MotB
MPKKKKGGGHEGGDERWLITYADLITLLLGLFVVLWTMGLADLEKYGRVAAAMKTVFGGKALVPGLPPKVSAAGPYLDVEGGSYPDTSEAYLTLKLQESLEDISNIAGKVSVEVEERGVVVHLEETVLFDLGRARLQEEAKTLLRKIAPVLVKSGRPIMIEGHTDNLPIRTLEYPSNWQLSAARAANVVYYLSRYCGVPKGQLSISAYADQKPVAPNDTPEGRRKNRRVDIVFLKGQWKTNRATGQLTDLKTESSPGYQ